MEVAVRNADSHYGLSVINYYIVMGLDRAKAMSDIADTKSVHLRVYHTLLNTMCDTYIAIDWRESCYKYLDKMMPLLSTMFTAKEFKKYKYELNVLYQYYCNPQPQKIKS